jgi:transcriptional antiterminator NusG
VIENSHNSSQVHDDAAAEPRPVVPQAPSFDAAASGGMPPHDTPRPEHPESVPQEPLAGDATPEDQSTLGDPQAAGGAIGDEAADESVESIDEIIEEEVEPRGPIEETPVAEEPPQMDWYILKVQSNREDSIRDSLQRRVKVAGLERFFGEVIVPTEMVSEFKGGKKRVVKRKLYPGYLVAHMEINDETWFLVRETPGIGDFTGSAGKPTPMQPHEVAKIVAKQEEKSDEAPKLKINFNVGDRVKINEGTFENFEGEVDSIDEASGRVTVMINIFGRSTPVELEYWQIETI